MEHFLKSKIQKKNTLSVLDNDNFDDGDDANKLGFHRLQMNLAPTCLKKNTQLLMTADSVHALILKTWTIVEDFWGTLSDEIETKPSTKHQVVHVHDNNSRDKDKEQLQPEVT